MSDARSNTPVLKASRPKKVRNIRLTLRRPFFMLRQAQHKTLSLSKGFIIPLAIIFIVNSLGGDLLLGESWAAKVSSGLTSVGPEEIGSPTPLKNLSTDTFTLPRELGYIQEATKVPESVKTVIHIQDAHCNYPAQKAIAEILGYLTKEYGIYAVNCEGAKDSYDLSPFTSIPEKDIRHKVSDYFVREGVVSAAEFFAVNNPQQVRLWGVEDADLYIKDLKIYRDSLLYKDECDRYIKSIGYIFDNLKRHIYPERLLEQDSYYTRYKDDKVSLKEYMGYLIQTSGKLMINIKSYPNIYLLSQTLSEEEKIDFRKANNEKDEVVDKLKKILSRNELEELIIKVGQLKVERISQADFYAYLVKKAASIKLNLASYPELQKYIVYISLYSAVDRAKVAQEISALEDRIKESLYENDTQRELGILSKNLTLMKNLFNISLTRDDYTYYQEHRASFNVSNFVKFIEAKAPLYKIQAVLDKNIGMLDEYRERMEGFYECSLERDKAFIRNIKFTDHDRPNSIIITGGFHTQSLRELFNKEKVSYISIMPNFKNPPGYQSPYLKRLAGQRTALENVIDTAIPAVLNLAAVEILSNRLAMEVEGLRNLNITYLAILILAEVNRGKNFILKINKGVYPVGRRPDEDKIITFAKGESADMPFKEVPTMPGTTKFNAAITKLTPDVVEFETLIPQEEAVPIAPEIAMPPTPVVKMPSVTSMENIIALAKAPRPDRLEMVRLMGEQIDKLMGNDQSKGPVIIRSILDSILGLERPAQNEIIMALRTAVMIKGLGEIRPTGLNVVVQVAPIGQRSSAESESRKIEDKLGRYYNNLNVQSIIGEGIGKGDVAGLVDLINRTRNAMRDSPGALALLLLPDYLQDIFNKAAEEAQIMSEGKLDLNFRVQFVDQGDMPDLISQFVLGIEILEYVRAGQNPENVSQRLLNLIAAMVEGDVNPFDVLRNDLFKTVLKIRPVNWESLVEQRKSWEAVRQSV